MENGDGSGLSNGFIYEPGLADAGLADHFHDAARSIDQPVSRSSQHSHLGISAD